jgi:SAM-dependent MidA family methyltransferase
MKIDYALNIRNRIENLGSISIAEFREIAISGKDGYYQNNVEINKNGDFITAPEISQLFGEIIAIWIYRQWQSIGSPKSYNLVELGPGNGSLMRDILRSFRSFKDFSLPKEIFLVEISEKLIERQRSLIAEFHEFSFNWLPTVFALPNEVSIFIGNEFFDAMPIEQYVKNKEHWSVVNLALAPENYDFRFIEIPLQKNFSDDLNDAYPHAGHRSFVEQSPKSLDVIKFIASLIKNTGGGALFIDYGYYINPLERRSFMPTLQAVKNHKYHPVLHDICCADLSAHVDFWALEDAVVTRDCNTKVLSQKHFLIENGLEIRTKLLMSKANEQEREMLANAFHRLTDKSQMGELFKVIIIF